MAAPTKLAEQPSKTRHYLFGGLGVLVVVSIVLLVWGLRRPPQMGTDEEVFKTVDALFTAVTARDEKLLTHCEQRLTTYKEAGSLPPKAAAHLDGIVRQARAGRWEPAAQSLYDFMIAQRREGRVSSKKSIP
jgi:hypothetical protein